jgi:hypothetical protein
LWSFAGYSGGIRTDRDDETDGEVEERERREAGDGGVVAGCAADAGGFGGEF